MCEHASFIVYGDEIIHYDKLKSHEEILVKAGLARANPYDRDVLAWPRHFPVDGVDYNKVYRPEWHPVDRKLEWDVMYGAHAGELCTRIPAQSVQDLVTDWINEHWNSPRKIAKWVRRNHPTCVEEMVKLVPLKMGGELIARFDDEPDSLACPAFHDAWQSAWRKPRNRIAIWRN